MRRCRARATRRGRIRTAARATAIHRPRRIDSLRDSASRAVAVPLQSVHYRARRRSADRSRTARDNEPGVRVRQRKIVSAHLCSQPNRLRLRLRRRVDQQGRQIRFARRSRRRKRLFFGARPPAYAVAPDIRFAVGQEHRDRRSTAASHRRRQLDRRVDAARERRTAAAGQSGETSFRANERTRRRQQQLRGCAAKCDQRDAIAPRVAVGQQQFDRALSPRRGDSTPTIRMRRPRKSSSSPFDACSASRESPRRALRSVPPRRVANGAPEALPRRCGAQGFHDVQCCAAARRTRSNADRATAARRTLQRTRLARFASAHAQPAAVQQLRKNSRRDRGLGRVEHDFVG